MTDLLELAQRVAGQAAPGEQVEAYVGQGTSTTVRVHGGEIESLTQASSAGIGIRVVKDKKQGIACAGSDTVCDLADGRGDEGGDPAVRQEQGEIFDAAQMAHMIGVQHRQPRNVERFVPQQLPPRHRHGIYSKHRQ